VKPLNFVLVGVGGQGILLASDVLCQVGLAAGYDVKKTDVHGMAQRGGSVVSHVRLADRVFSPMVATGEADFLLAFEKLEACRWAGYLRPGGTAVVNDERIPTLAALSGSGKRGGPTYPDDATIAQVLAGAAGQVVMVPAGRIAAEMRSPRVANVVLLGALSRLLDIPEDRWLSALADRVPARHRDVNLRAFSAGREAALLSG
jgi:indolepyruvate ferredoxin oxidoreductase beta subunit